MDIGRSMREIRSAAGISLARMADRTHYSKSLLGHVETGRRAAREEHVLAYSRVLDVPVAMFYGPAEDPLRLAHEWLVSESPARVHREAGARAGASLADELERRVAELRHLDDVVGGNRLFPLVRKEFEDVRPIVADVSGGTSVGRRLLGVFGELAQLAGWVCSDAGRYAEAQRLYLSGVEAAREAGNRELAGQLLSSLSYQLAEVGNPADAALLARTAVRGLSPAATPLVRALLTERVAWACAKAKDRDGARRALDGVEVLHAGRTGDEPEPEWVYWLDRREIDVMAARCHLELGDPRTAEPLLVGALDGYHPEHVREVALYKTWLAQAHGANGDLDAARTTLAEARALAANADSVRLDHRLHQAGTTLP